MKVVFKQIDPNLCGFQETGKLTISSEIKGRLCLDTIVHEAVHEITERMGIELSERRVRRFSGILTEVLWKTGYRRRIESKGKSHG